MIPIRRYLAVSPRSQSASLQLHLDFGLISGIRKAEMQNPLWESRQKPKRHNSQEEGRQEAREFIQLSLQHYQLYCTTSALPSQA